ncbi:MAG: flavin reductase family protein [Actinobacteria bacterium]|nr:flavin reductase family protein [Actinomycetota bacterium]
MAPDSIDPLHYRRVLGYFPTGVTVITACTADREPIGFTIGSFASVSLDPPLVGFLPMVTSDRWAAIRDAGTFCVNVLAADQGDLCWRFAKTDVVAPFEGVNWRQSAVTGSPIIAGSIAWIDCSIDTVVAAGDHDFVIGRVLQLEHAPPEQTPNALLFFRGQLGRFTGHD